MATKLTAPIVMNELCDHLTRHKDVYDPRSEKLHKTVYGEQGTNGLNGSMEIQKLSMKHIEERLKSIDETIDERVSKIEGGIVWLNRLIVGGVITAVLASVLIK